MNITHHIPSHISTAGNKVLVSYEGQHSACYVCNETNDQYQDYPLRKRVAPRQTLPLTSTWADVVS